MTSEELERAVLSLPAEERAKLAQKLIASLEDEPTDEIEEAWIREADRRAEEIMRGEVELVPGDEVLREALARLRSK